MLEIKVSLLLRKRQDEPACHTTEKSMPLLGTREANK